MASPLVLAVVLGHFIFGTTRVALAGGGEGRSNAASGTITITATNTASAPAAPAPSSAPSPSVAPAADQQSTSTSSCTTTVDPHTPVLPMSVPGTWYSSCQGAYFVPTGATAAAAKKPAPAPPPLTPQQLSEIAVKQIQLQAPALQLSPASEDDPAVKQIVNAPTWAWLPGGSWHVLTATATAGPVVVTAKATPESIGLTYVDGGQSHTTSCAGPGTPYSNQLAEREDPSSPLSAASPNCGWTFRYTSSGAPGGLDTVSGTITYDVTWAVTGAAGGGNLGPLTSPVTTYRLPVDAIEAVNTNQ